MKWELDDLAGASHLAKLLGVSQQVFANHKAHWESFPAPLFERPHPVYSIQQVTEWYAQRSSKEQEKINRRIIKLEKELAELRSQA